MRTAPNSMPSRGANAEAVCGASALPSPSHCESRCARGGAGNGLDETADETPRWTMPCESRESAIRVGIASEACRSRRAEAGAGTNSDLIAGTGVAASAAEDSSAAGCEKSRANRSASASCASGRERSDASKPERRRLPKVCTNASIGPSGADATDCAALAVVSATRVVVAVFASRRVVPLVPAGPFMRGRWTRVQSTTTDSVASASSVGISERNADGTLCAIACVNNDTVTDPSAA